MRLVPRGSILFGFNVHVMHVYSWLYVDAHVVIVVRGICFYVFDDRLRRRERVRWGSSAVSHVHVYRRLCFDVDNNNRVRG
jgi:hypothetical protein